jgi:hypothetical protein
LDRTLAIVISEDKLDNKTIIRMSTFKYNKNVFYRHTSAQNREKLLDPAEKQNLKIAKYDDNAIYIRNTSLSWITQLATILVCHYQFSTMIKLQGGSALFTKKIFNSVILSITSSIFMQNGTGKVISATLIYPKQRRGSPHANEMIVCSTIASDANQLHLNFTTLAITSHKSVARIL